MKGQIIFLLFALVAVAFVDCRRHGRQNRKHGRRHGRGDSQENTDDLSCPKHFRHRYKWVAGHQNKTSRVCLKIASDFSEPEPTANLCDQPLRLEDFCSGDPEMVSIRFTKINGLCKPFVGCNPSLVGATPGNNYANISTCAKTCNVNLTEQLRQETREMFIDKIGSNNGFENVFSCITAAVSPDTEPDQFLNSFKAVLKMRMKSKKVNKRWAKKRDSPRAFWDRQGCSKYWNSAKLEVCSEMIPKFAVKIRAAF